MVRIKAFHYDGLQPKERLAKIKAFWLSWKSFKKKSFFSQRSVEIRDFLDSGLSHNYDRIFQLFLRETGTLAARN